jgi:lipopolysaccharide transport system ATP-binding protein
MGFSRSEMLERVDAITEFADIGAFIDEPIRHYSSGMTVRLGFAVATSLRPDILITDEVLAVGDESFQKKCVQWIERYLENGGTLLLCSHSMFHVQTLCSHAVWIHQGRQRLYGDAFEVTREYLTYHEEKRRSEGVAYRPPPMGAIPRIESAWIESGGGEKVARIASGEDLVVQGVAYEPDDRPPVLLVGIIRADGTPVYGSHSNETAYRPHRIAPRRFAFALRFASPGLLPGKYSVRAHALDPEGLRMCDTVEMEVVVSGASRDYGLVRLEHEWQPGRGEE